MIRIISKFNKIRADRRSKKLALHLKEFELAINLGSKMTKSQMLKIKRQIIQLVKDCFGI
jgi:hypothetical protein